MERKLFIALVMAAVLFIYGYVLSTTGHDHAAHQHGGNHLAVEQRDEEPKHDHSDHGHH